MDDDYEDGRNDEQNDGNYKAITKKSNVLPLWGNERTMNLNPLILTNIQSSHYFKVNLYELKTYHEVIDEIYFKVNHLEPWEKGSRKTAGQTGMCGGVRGVGAGGIVSTAFCLLYKLFTLKLSRKQVIGLITHPDSPYIRVLGFMYIRYTQPPADLWDWYEDYLDELEELDVKAGGGQVMTIGNILKNFLCKLEWFSTLFPRIPVPIQQKLERKMNERYPPVGPVPKGLGGTAIPWNRPSDDFSRSQRSNSKSARSEERTDRRWHNDEYRRSRETSRQKSRSVNDDSRYSGGCGTVSYSRDISVGLKADSKIGRRSRSRSDSRYRRRIDVKNDSHRRHYYGSDDEQHRDRYKHRHGRSVSRSKQDERKRQDSSRESRSREEKTHRRIHNMDEEKAEKTKTSSSGHTHDRQDRRRRHGSDKEQRNDEDVEMVKDYHERKHNREIDDIIRHHKEKMRHHRRESIAENDVDGDDRYADDVKKHRRKHKHRDRFRSRSCSTDKKKSAYADVDKNSSDHKRSNKYR